MSKFNDVEWWKEHVKEGDWLKLIRYGDIVMGEYIKVDERSPFILITVYTSGVQKQVDYPIRELIDVKFRRGSDWIIADSIRNIYTNLER